MIKDIIPQNLLSEESLNEIETAFSNRIKLHVEQALTTQDELYAKKLEALLEAINADHCAKLSKVVEAIDKNNAAKLVKVIEKYERELNNGASQFKDQLVESLSTYIDTYIEELIPAESVNEAVKNKQALTVLEGLRKTLAVDSALMTESIKEAVIEGKQQIDEANQQADALVAENAKLKKEIDTLQKAIFIESNTSKMAPNKADYIKKILQEKNITFVKENFDYISKLYDKKEAEQTEVIKEQALNNRVGKHDAPKVVVEQTTKKDPFINSYLTELNRVK
jgi:cell division protein FtsB